MHCQCEKGPIKRLTIEGDIGADPVWCSDCGCNLELEDFPFPADLAAKLEAWVQTYGEWMDWETERLKPGGLEMEAAFNAKGQALTEQAAEQLAGYTITFSPSTSASEYDKLDNQQE